jgi:uncharacterized membrane protein
LTKNQTGLGLFSAFGIELLVLLLLTLAAGVAVTNYVWTARENLRRSDIRTGHRTRRKRLAA